MSQEKYETIDPPIIKQVRCKSLHKYTGNVLKYKEIYKVIKEKKDFKGNVYAYKLMDLEGNILKSHYLKWRFYDTDLISDISSIKSKIAAVHENMGLSFYLYSLNDSMAAFSTIYKKEVISYFLSGDSSTMLTTDTYVEMLNIPAITETINFLNLEEIKNRISFLISKDIIVKDNDSIRLTSKAIDILKLCIGDKLDGSKHLLDKEILLNDLYKLQSSYFKPFTEPMYLLQEINLDYNYFLGINSIPVFVFIFFKKINKYTNANTITHFKTTLQNYICNKFSFYYKKDNEFINNQTYVKLTKEIHNFTYGKPYLVLNSKKIRNSLEIIKLKTDNDNIFKYIDKRYLKIIEKEDTIPLFMFYKFTKSLSSDYKLLNYIDIAVYKLCFIFILSQYKFKKNIVIKNKDKNIIKAQILEQIISCLGSTPLYNTKSWFHRVPQNPEEPFEINSKKLELQIKAENGFNMF